MYHNQQTENISVPSVPEIQILKFIYFPSVPCTKCDMEFKRVEDMKAHSLIHYGEITCPIHNILFYEESEVYQHVNKNGPEDKFPKLECCICNKTFKHMCLFMKHLRKELRIAPYR